MFSELYQKIFTKSGSISKLTVAKVQIKSRMYYAIGPFYRKILPFRAIASHWPAVFMLVATIKPIKTQFSLPENSYIPRKNTTFVASNCFGIKLNKNI